ncbi:10005_t:CDS:2 [Racocetra fulgida]|uniref:10005_t:CDS:1 n=1 Tax=Racocetra fulgida TaxID=60492 RepID=A0A9N9GU35_9GLOM|nr:10005_t:CDS:2 [Racocetra fulgida]
MNENEKMINNDLIIQYNKHLIDSEEKKVLFEIYIDKEFAKNKFEEEIKQILEETTNSKIKIVVKLNLD